LNKLVKTGYQGENWPWAEVTQKAWPEEYKKVADKLAKAPLKSSPRAALSAKEQSLMEKIRREFTPANYHTNPDFKKRVQAELSDPKIVGEKAIRAKQQLADFLSNQYARRQRHSLKNKAKKAAGSGIGAASKAKPTSATKK